MMFWLELAISFIVTWGVGLGPALIARYLVVKRALKLGSARWIAGLSSIFFFLAFRLAYAFAGIEEPGRGLVWVLVFFVSVWIMSRGYNDQLSVRIDAQLNDESLSHEVRSKLEQARRKLKK